MNPAKAQIIASIQRHLSLSRDIEATQVENGRHRSAEAGEEVNGSHNGDAITCFQENFAAVGGRLIRVADLAASADAISELLTQLGASSVATSNAPLVRSVISRVRTSASIQQNPSGAVLFRCEVGITSAQWAIAETGTLVLESARESSRFPSLVPDVHICILEADRIRQTMGEILAIMNHDLSPAVTFVTGPSRTSDIELIPAIGVHGPRALYVVLIK